jgi:hypothetical protein
VRQSRFATNANQRKGACASLAVRPKGKGLAQAPAPAPFPPGARLAHPGKINAPMAGHSEREWVARYRQLT